MEDVTVTLAAAASGDLSARDALQRDVYEHLRAIARKKMAGERAGHTLGATALVHEAFVKLVGQDQVSFNNRAHFLALASLAMRRLLVSHARIRRAEKRGAGARAITFEDDVMGAGLAIDDMVAIDTALAQLAAMNERQAAVVAYRAFGGMTDREIAEVVDVSVPTVRRDYRLAAAWLRRELT